MCAPLAVGAASGLAMARCSSHPSRTLRLNLMQYVVSCALYGRLLTNTRGCMQVSTVVLGALLFCSLALNGAGLWWYLHRHSAATTVCVPEPPCGCARVRLSIDVCHAQARHFKLPTSPERDIARHGRDLHSPSPGDRLELARVQMHEESGDEHSGVDDDELGDDVALVPPSRGSLGVR